MIFGEPGKRLSFSPVNNNQNVVPKRKQADSGLFPAFSDIHDNPLSNSFFPAQTVSF